MASHTLENSKDANQHIEEESEGDGETYISHKKGWGLVAPFTCHQRSDRYQSQGVKAWVSNPSSAPQLACGLRPGSLAFLCLSFLPVILCGEV